ncbi:adenylate kinase [Sulfodiicoccus acidiphilus]|uniref:Adenylate kinase n=1 Tax=Sulfodiicoccus acidiphilus TaxID=1670455 RepID=A0A348B166_9CREN|nr:adenylate kinase [Sulfodiicoccus acidiphilus]BBD71918.1 adenylate kinase [Sulfodiicoccus acidiphilus]GGT91452.1 adenylate kinase [Sulfodiicoccus acidiphilus]
MAIGIVTGIPGVGKTTVLGKVEELLSKRGVRYKIMNYGDYMLRRALEGNYVKDRDQIRKLPLNIQKELQLQAAKAMYDEAQALGEGGVGLVDTHAVVRTPQGYLPGLPKHIIEILGPNVIFLIEAPPALILERQKRDQGRSRLDYSEESVIEEVMQFARSFAVASATLVGASVKIVINREGSPEEAAAEVVKVLTGG